MSDAKPETTVTKCQDTCPLTWTGHWRDWHRGHGCNLDLSHPDVALRRDAAERARKELSQRFGRRVEALDNRDGTISITCDTRDVIALLKPAESAVPEGEALREAHDERAVRAVAQGHLAVSIFMLCPDAQGVAGPYAHVEDVPLTWNCSCGKAHRFTMQDAYVTFVRASVVAPSTDHPHRCSGCGHRWSGGPPSPNEWRGAELCGDCWRLAQPVLHGSVADQPVGES